MNHYLTIFNQYVSSPKSKNSQQTRIVPPEAVQDAEDVAPASADCEGAKLKATSKEGIMNGLSINGRYEKWDGRYKTLKRRIN